MSELHRITVDAEHCGGRPCIRGLRVRVTDILDLLAAGASHEEILADYPYLVSVHKRHISLAKAQRRQERILVFL